MSEDDRYTLWNHIIANAFLLSDAPDGVVQLPITPESLARANEEAREPPLSPGDAAQSLASAVSAVYRSKVIGNPIGLQALSSGDPGDVPYATAFLALTVLAAYRMHTDDDRSAAAFYLPLSEMLRCRQVPTYPEGFDGDLYIALWDGLNEWLVRDFGRRLVSPDRTVRRRFTAFPLAHVPLRQVDIERLPQFFEIHGYQPGMRPSVSQLAFDLVERSGPWTHLTKSGRIALADPLRHDFVIRQVLHVLEHWNGETTEAAGTRIASIDLGMDIRRRRAELHLLPRRPPGFPETLGGGAHVFVASYEGWYESVPLGPEDGPLLAEGLRVGSARGRGEFALQLRARLAVPLTPSPDHSGFVSDRALRADAQCAVLCKDEVADSVERHLEAICGHRVQSRSDDTLPIGWRLFAGVRPTIASPPPPGLEMLAVESDLRLVCEGGLRLGRRWTWLEDAPARVRVVGSRDGLVARIDGRDVEIDDDGCLPSEPLAGGGQHVIEVGNRIRRTVTVLPGKVNPECAPWPVSDDPCMRVAIPEGEWFVVGRRPGEHSVAVLPAGGSLLAPKFCPSWAIQVGAGRGAVAVHLHGESLNGRVPESDPRDAATWAETIYRAKVRNAAVHCPFGCPPAEVRREWKEFADLARAWKRQAKRRSSRARRTPRSSPSRGRGAGRSATQPGARAEGRRTDG